MTPHPTPDQWKQRADRASARSEQAAEQYATLLAQNPLVLPQDARQGKRTAIYLRQSRDSNLLGEGVDRQYDHCWARAGLDDLDVVAIYVDNDTSARSKSVVRPSYQQLVESLRKGELDNVLVITQDRLLRRPREMEDLIDIAEVRLFHIIGALEPMIDLSTAAGRRSARELVNYAAFEGDRRTERQLLRNAQEAKLGRPPHHRLLGYSTRKLGGVWHSKVEPDQAPIVVEMFGMAAAGAPLRVIARDMTDRYGEMYGKFTHSRVRNMVTSRRYLGERWHRGEFVSKGEWEPIVSTELFEAAANALKANSGNRTGDLARRGARAIARKYVGTNVYRCGVCGGYARAQWRKFGHRPQIVYVCPEKTHVSRVLDETDAYVLDAVAERLTQDGVISSLMRSVDHADELAELRQQEATLLRKVERAQNDYAEELIDGALYKSITVRANEKLAEVRERLGELGGLSPVSMLADDPDPADRFLNAAVGIQGMIIDAVAEVLLHRSLRRGRRSKDWKITDVVEIRWKV